MMNSLKKILGFGPSVDYTKLMSEGAIVLDVRTVAEFEDGHIDGAINIPIETLRDHMHQLTNKQATIIACCKDGSKSWYAKNLLDASGYRNVHDAGSWSKLQKAARG